MVKIINTAEQPDLNPDQTSWVYNGLDCAVTLEIWKKMQRYLTPVTRKTYELSKAMQGPVLDMNMHGILIDQQAFGEMREEANIYIARLENRLEYILKEGYGVTINWRSPKDMTWFLYEYLYLPVQKKRNQMGVMSITSDRAALEVLWQGYYNCRPAITPILMLRDIAKKLTVLSAQIDKDNRFQSSYNIAGTNTGRMSSAHGDYGDGSNAQNIDRRIRRGFVPPRRKKFANLDLAQADSRNVGATCWNRFVDLHGESFAGSYLDACESGDLHTTVTKMARPELDWPTDPAEWRRYADTPIEAMRGKSYRDASKGWGHGSNYLLTPASAVKKIPGVGIQAAIDFRDNYFSAFPCIPLWHEAVNRDILDFARVTTIWGRQRYFFGRPGDPATHRAAVAYDGQSATADAINHGMMKLWRGGKRFPGFQFLLQVHDSVMFQYDEECEDEIIPWALDALCVPLILARGREFIIPTDAKVGWNWGDYNDNPKYGPLNVDGLKGWKGHDKRTRQNPYHPVYRLAI